MVKPSSDIQILVVEDSRVEAELLRRSLARAGYRVLLAENGEDGLQALREHACALVMSDIQMPLMDGYQLCREIKHDESLRDIPVILLTMLSEPEDIIEAIKAGADSYVSKPFVEDIMLEQIHSLLVTPASRRREEARPAERIEYNGKFHTITASNQQVLNLLLSVYRNTFAQNRELLETRLQLGMLNDSLDQKVQERTTELQESEARIRTILDTALDAFIGMDSTGLVTSWNAEAERIFGYSPAEAIGQKLAGLIIPPDQHGAHEDGLKRFAETGDGPLVGRRAEVSAMRKDGSEFPAELSITATGRGKEISFNAFARDITERRQAESKISFLAYHDQLTGLPNRELFYDRMSQAISLARRKHERMALLFLDLDGFKAINDNYGHEAGDTVLKATSSRLQTCVRSVDTVARLGGDEFTIILGEVAEAADVTSVAEKIIAKLIEPIPLGNERECGISASIGIAIYPENGYEIDKLMSAADSAMYESKASGKNTYAFFRKNQERKGSRSLMDFDASCLLGVPEIDMQHRELANMVNRLGNAVRQHEPAEIAMRLFDELLAHTRYHFETEERLMAQHGYAETETHRQEHQRLLEEASHLRERFAQGEQAVVLQALRDWLLSHILNVDKPLAQHLLQRQDDKPERS